MNQTINIKTHKENGDWCNIKTEDGKDVSLNLKSSPKLKALIDECISLTGDFPGSLTGNLIESKGKLFLWDVKEENRSNGGQKKYSNASQEAIIAQSVYSSTANRFQGSQMALDNKAFNEVCEERFNWVMSKIKPL